ncbi:MAG: virulence RhuM family protein [Bacteroidales bacterium]|nr:virulence RhuM family protein [Candidatus Colicola caccequi]
MNEQNEIVLYQPNELTKLEVRVENESVWLNVNQMAELFGRDRTVITRHISNIFKEGEVDISLGCAKFALSKHYGRREGFSQTLLIDYYNLDVIISVGYRVHSLQGVAFRRWATSVLKDYMLRGYAVNQRLLALEEKVDRSFARQERILTEHQEKLDFFVRTALPPAEQVFFEGNFFTARVALESLVKTAKQRVIVIDGYVDAQTFDILDVRAKGVVAAIYTNGVGSGMQRLIATHDAEKGKEHIEVHQWKNKSHDRWLIIDDTLYHCGHSLNAMGNHLSAICQMGINPDEILKQII